MQICIFAALSSLRLGRQPLPPLATGMYTVKLSEVKKFVENDCQAVGCALVLWLIHSSRNKFGFFWSAVPMAGLTGLDSGACDFEEQLVKQTPDLKS